MFNRTKQMNIVMSGFRSWSCVRLVLRDMKLGIWVKLFFNYDDKLQDGPKVVTQTFKLIVALSFTQ